MLGIVKEQSQYHLQLIANRKLSQDMRRALVVCVVLAMVLSLPLFIEAIVMMDPTVSVPVNRLIINTTKYIKAHPKDSQGYYLLGRLHSFAFAGNTHSDPKP